MDPNIAAPTDGIAGPESQKRIFACLLINSREDAVKINPKAMPNRPSERIKRFDLDQ
jgi:hypothetical protein